MKPIVGCARTCNTEQNSLSTERSTVVLALLRWGVCYWREIGMNVLSLFDGISCGMVALERAGIKVDKYYASEIDQYAIKISEKNYPNIIRLGDVTK